MDENAQGLALAVREIFAKAWRDPAFKAQLLANPAAALTAEGIDLRPGLAVTAVETTDTNLYFVLPANSISERHEEFSTAMRMAATQAEGAVIENGAHRHQAAGGAGEIIAKACRDAAFKARLIANAAATLKAEGIVLPAGQNVTVLENTDTHFYLALPPNPDGEMSDEALDSVVGGSKVMVGLAVYAAVALVTVCVGAYVLDSKMKQAAGLKKPLF